MKTITEKNKISLPELKLMSEKMFGGLVKAVVDIEQKIMVVDAGLHADQEYLLLEEGSQQAHLWGINIFPEQFGKDEFIVFDSMINLRPGFGNRSRSVDNPKIQIVIREIVHKLVIS
ncbi:MAG TPA: DUF5674 family protein [Candidatus Babeliales bacterium]|nr:DUF5674 family protein [Candidatus Babeliales bacterium]